MIALHRIRKWTVIATLLALGFLFLGAFLMWHSEPTPAISAGRELVREELELRDGRLYARGENETFNGKIIEIYTAERRKLEIEINDGRAHGLSRGWFDNGQFEVEENFLNGVSNGPRTRWHRNGERKSLARIENGVIGGEFLEWHDNGQLATRMTLSEGEPIGLVEAWHPSGALKSQVHFENGKQVSSQFFDDISRVAETR